MAMYCTSCGKQLDEGVAFCTECGAKNETKHCSPLSPPSRNGVQPKVVKIQTEENKKKEIQEEIGTMYFFGHIFMYSIPAVGWIYCLIMSFAASSKTKRSFARAMLIYCILAILICTAVYFAVQAASVYALSVISDFAGIEITSWTEITKLADSNLLTQFESLKEFGELSDIVNLLDQFKNMDLSALEGLEGIDLSVLEEFQNINP